MADGHQLLIGAGLFEGGFDSEHGQYLPVALVAEAQRQPRKKDIAQALAHPRRQRRGLDPRQRLGAFPAQPLPVGDPIGQKHRQQRVLRVALLQPFRQVDREETGCAFDPSPTLTHVLQCRFVFVVVGWWNEAQRDLHRVTVLGFVPHPNLVYSTGSDVRA
jgi:hypothetical protein